MITKYNTHINIKICSSVLTVKYLYNYIYKGYDQAIIAFFQLKNYSNIQTTETKPIDKIKTYLDAKYISSSKSI